MPKKPSAKATLSIGRMLAKHALERRKKAAATRSRALAHRQDTVALTPPSGKMAQAGIAKAARASAGVLIAEGDSWFDYPLHDVLKELEDQYGFDVQSVAHKGDTVEDMAYAGGQLDDFARCIEKALRTWGVPRAILLSGGGNDVAGGEFAIMLNHALSGVAGINDSVANGVINERLKDAYVTILSAVTEICRRMIGQPVPIVLHGYDYPVPDGRGFLGGGGLLPGPWLDPGFRRKGYEDMGERMKLLVRLIDRFNDMLIRLPKVAGLSHVRYLDLRGTLSTGTDYKKWWANELHPTAKGFSAVTAKFAAVI